MISGDGLVVFVGACGCGLPSYSTDRAASDAYATCVVPVGRWLYTAAQPSRGEARCAPAEISSLFTA